MPDGSLRLGLQPSLGAVRGQGKASGRACATTFALQKLRLGVANSASLRLLKPCCYGPITSDAWCAFRFIVAWHLALVTWQGTYSNYLGHLRTACLALEVPMPPAEHPAVIRAKTSIVKRMLYSPKPRMFIQRTMVRNMFLSAERGLLTVRMAMLWLASYLFLLRVPSEALPMIRGDSVLAQSNQSTMYLDDEGKLCLKFQRRKNRPGGSLLRRNCSCAACPKVCPVHVLWHQFFMKLPLGAAPWKDVSPDKARSSLRATLAKLGVRDVRSCLLFTLLASVAGAQCTVVRDT